MLAKKSVSRIKDLFVNTPTNAQRIYGLQFYNLGIPYTVVIDDYAAVTKGNAVNGAFSKLTDNNGLWPMLLEKAFAKFYGNYDAINGGNFNKAIELMTGYPGESISLSDFTVDSLWEYL